MLAKRIIPCLDVKDGRVVKGVELVDLQDKADPAEHARRYDDEGADEIALLDITATVDGRRATLDVVALTAEATFTPLTVGGGIRAEGDVEASAGDWEVVTHGGRTRTGISAVAWAERVARLGAGEILLTSMDRDGMQTGYDLDLLRAIADVVGVPIIASGVAVRSAHEVAT